VLDVMATAPQYADHLAAVFSALPESDRGAFIAPRGPVADHVRALGFEPAVRTDRSNHVLVASYGDLVRAASLGRSRIAIMEHGAGQSYGGRHVTHGAYAGGRNRDAASLFLHPGPHPAERDRAAYPGARIEVVGSPILDTLPDRIGAKGRVVAVSFHFNTTIAPETKNAVPWIWPAVLGLRDRFDLIGHSHPRMGGTMSRRYRLAGIPFAADFDDVCRRADVYVCDNSSTLFAFAATGRPVVVLNPPWYDKHVDHGLRFWEAAGVGVQVNDPADLPDAIEKALRDTPTQKRRREEALDLVYAYRTGASQRAADVLLDWAA
jgi:hypothetical protein